MSTLNFKKTALLSAAVVPLFFSAYGQTQERPNILWLTSEDNSPDYLGCYGNKNTTTPNLDRLSVQGVTFDNAFSNATVCAPSRFTIITGMYASACGTQHMRSNYPIPEEFRFFPEYLRNAGYYCTNNVKEDYNLDLEQWKENVSKAWDESSNKAHYKNRKEGQPFFAVFNTTLSHEHKVHYQLLKEDDEFLHNPKDLELAPYHPDLMEIRRCYAQYYDYITEMDTWVGEMLEELEESGLAENTIVFYFSDHGGVLPRSKTYIYESGTKVPMIIRFPEKYRHLAPGKPGSRNDRLVSFVDLAPTILSLAGVEIPDNFLGNAFLGRKKTEDPEYVHFFRARDDENIEMIRAVRTKKYRYIRNYMPHRLVGQHGWYIWRCSAVRAWEDAYHKGLCNEVQSRYFQIKESPEELYDITTDPHNIKNLAMDPKYAGVLKELREENQRWILENRDAGFLPEGMMIELSSGNPPYRLMHSEDFSFERIFSTAEMATSKDPGYLSELISRLSDDHPGVRYWAATGCAVLGEKAGEAAPRLQKMLTDNYGNNRVAAAEALVRMGITEEPFKVLINEMNCAKPLVPMHALNALRGLGDLAEPAVKDIMNGLNLNVQRKHYFMRGYVDLLNKLKPGWGDYVTP